jgi:hypothetical protein
MKVLLTRGSGNLRQTVVPRLLDEEHLPVILDVRAPPRYLLRQVVYEGLREDKPATDVRRELPSTKSAETK